MRNSKILLLCPAVFHIKTNNHCSLYKILIFLFNRFCLVQKSIDCFVFDGETPWNGWLLWVLQGVWDKGNSSVPNYIFAVIHIVFEAESSKVPRLLMERRAIAISYFWGHPEFPLHILFHGKSTLFGMHYDLVILSLISSLIPT